MYKGSTFFFFLSGKVFQFRCLDVFSQKTKIPKEYMFYEYILLINFIHICLLFQCYANYDMMYQS